MTGPAVQPGPVAGAGQHLVHALGGQRPAPHRTAQRHEHPVGAGHVRPKFACDGDPALWVTERGGRVLPPEINARFEAYRDALGLPAVLVVHSLRLFLPA